MAFGASSVQGGVRGVLVCWACGVIGLMGLG